ncbi:hypothetical protein [Cryptosporangium sp. NPDC051539]|uniref:hypothetical protein n=1 Tax=Cryptosporangium sp. NPDC051539 TaxID=3363962 RepID=UPI00378E0DB4
MPALQQTSLDGPRALRLITDAPVPRPGRGEVLVRVTAAGVNYRDVMQARGTSGSDPVLRSSPVSKQPVRSSRWAKR